jgi:hypothetical protein
MDLETPLLLITTLATSPQKYLQTMAASMKTATFCSAPCGLVNLMALQTTV